jgi:hypothetical protein
MEPYSWRSGYRRRVLVNGAAFAVSTLRASPAIARI